MASSETQIANLALSHVGNSNQIASLTEKSNEARACLLWYEQCRDEVLGAFPWPFATTIQPLVLVATQPTNEWGFSYAYPADALTTYRIPSGVDRFAAGLSVPLGGWWLADFPIGWPISFPGVPIPYRIVGDGSGKLIYTDQPCACLEYTARLTDVTRYPADLVTALSLYLAGSIAAIVTGGDQFKLGDRALARYQATLSAARARAANEGVQDPPPQSEFITARY